MHPLFFFVGLLAVMAVVVVLSIRYERKRTQALQAFASSLHFAFCAGDDGQATAPFSSFALFNSGRSRRATNVMRGTANDTDVTIMDYRYTTGGGKNSHTWSQTVLALQSPLLQLPAFTLRPEHLFDRIGEVFGGRDIDFPSHPGFSGSFLLRSGDEAAVRKVFTPDLLSRCERCKGLSMETAGDRVVFYRASTRVRPEGLMAFMQEGFDLFAMLKSRT